MKISKIETLGMVDGPGIRTVIFTSGCPLRCLYCHNPDLWANNNDKEYSIDELINILGKYRTYYETSGGGITFSGGEPLIQENLTEVLKKCKENGFHTAIDTSGHFNNEDDTINIVKAADLIILDIKHFDDSEYQKLTGQPMDKLFKFIDILNNHAKEVWIRSVIIPSFNDNEEYLQGLAKLIKKIKHVTNTELLAYHNLAIEKYQNLNIDYQLNDIPALDTTKLDKLEEILKTYLNK